MEQLSLIHEAPIVHHLAEGLDPFNERSTQGADRPVAAEDHAVGAKFREDMVDDRGQVLGPSMTCPWSRPRCPRPCSTRWAAWPRQRCRASRPRIGREDLGVAAVVQDELRARAGLDQLRSVTELGGSHAQVETQAQVAQQADPLG